MAYSDGPMDRAVGIADVKALILLLENAAAAAAATVEDIMTEASSMAEEEEVMAGPAPAATNDDDKAGNVAVDGDDDDAVGHRGDDCDVDDVNKTFLEDDDENTVDAVFLCCCPEGGYMRGVVKTAALSMAVVECADEDDDADNGKAASPDDDADDPKFIHASALVDWRYEDNGVVAALPPTPRSSLCHIIFGVKFVQVEEEEVVMTVAAGASTFPTPSPPSTGLKRLLLRLPNAPSRPSSL